MVSYNITNRPYNYSSIVPISIELKNGQQDYSLDKYQSELQGHKIIGFFARRQGVSLGFQKKNYDDKVIADNDVFSMAHITLVNENSINVIDRLALDFVGYDNYTHMTGVFSQLLRDDKIKLSSSKVSISDPSVITTGEVLQLYFMVMHSADACSNVITECAEAKSCGC